jgi:hypothetical protein
MRRTSSLMTASISTHSILAVAGALRSLPLALRLG